ncbi:MAG: cation:proton antiporter [Methanomicrobiales archaeon]|nr:cation:proton antiporter [Methanomicrobiales archaeon]
MVVPLVSNVVLILAIALIVGLVCTRFRIPPLVAFILIGIIAGPQVLSLVGSAEEVDMLAEIGIVLLLFTIGLEFSFHRLWELRRMLLFGGLLQVALTFLLSFVIATLLGVPTGEAILLGFLISLSSTAIVLKILDERGEAGSPHGSITFGILLFQDIAAIPMMMAIPFLASITASAPVVALTGETLVATLGKDFLIVVILVIAARWGVPWLLYKIAQTRSREYFLLLLLLICFGVGWLVTLAGLSLAMGALVAGLLIAESEFSHQAIGSILPFRDIFLSFFFVSVGMLLDLQFLGTHLGLVILLILGVILLKAVTAAVVPLVLGYPVRTIVLVGIALAQVGEFSFILSQSGLDYGILTPSTYQAFLATALATMAATPFLIASGPGIADRLCRIPLISRTLGARCPVEPMAQIRLRDHLVIIGFGVTGKNLARAAAAGHIPHIIVEMNPETVRREREAGEPIIFGDATNDAVLREAAITEARIAVVAINDPVSVRRITDICRRMNPKLYLIIRTRYLNEVKPLHELGADEVIPEEFETSVEIFTRVLSKYLVPRDRIEEFITEIRSGAYQVLRNPAAISSSLPDLIYRVSDVSIISYTVHPSSPVAGKTLGEINLRKVHGILVLAVVRFNETITNPGGETRLEPHDIVVIQGTAEQVAKAASLFGGTATGSDTKPPRETGSPGPGTE